MKTSKPKPSPCARRVVRRRTAAGLDRDALAALARVPYRTLEKFERGVTQRLTSANLSRIAVALQVPEVDLLTGGRNGCA